MNNLAATIGELGSNLPKGYFYGLEIPYKLDQIQAAGPSWLTKALHAAGTLPKGNKVVEMSAQLFVGGGACQKAILEVKYEKPDKQLHERLFCKYPHDIGEPQAFANYWSFACTMNNDGAEIDFARMLS